MDLIDAESGGSTPESLEDEPALYSGKGLLEGEGRGSEVDRRVTAMGLPWLNVRRKRSSMLYCPAHYSTLTASASGRDVQ